MEKVVCISEATFHHGLTRGKYYDVLEVDAVKQQIRIRGDNERRRWFPMWCFNFNNQAVPIMTGFTVDDPISPDEDSLVEVTISFSIGERRWCIFGTPTALTKCGPFIEGTNLRFHYANRHLIIVEVLTESVIEQVLRYLDAQNELIGCSLLLDHDAEKIG